MYEDAMDMRHPMQRRSLARKNQLLGIIADHEGISQRKLITLCYVNFGWYPKTTKINIGLLIEFGSLVEEEGRLYTYTHTHPLWQKQAKLDE